MQQFLRSVVVVSLLLTVTASPVEDLLEEMVSQDTNTDEQWNMAETNAYEASLSNGDFAVDVQSESVTDTNAYRGLLYHLFTDFVITSSWGKYQLTLDIGPKDRVCAG